MEKVQRKIWFIVRNNILKFIPVLSVFSLLFIVLPKSAHAGSIYISPNSKSYSVGQVFSVSVIVNTPDKATNAVGGRITFPTDKVEVTSISKSGSVVNLWVSEPGFSNAEGVITFDGLVLNPGFVGSSGKVISVSFKAKSQGTANLTFTNGTLLANDGLGTSILSGLGSAQFTISPAAPKPSPTPKPELQEGMKIDKITSSTHPDSEKWYSNNNAKFEWTLPSGATGVSMSVDKVANTSPGDKSDEPVASYEAKNLESGIWYFHLKVRNSKGWGSDIHYKFQIDREKPDYFTIKEQERTDHTDPKLKINFESSDKLSGIDYYEIVIPDTKPIKWQDDGTHAYTTSAIKPGSHTIMIKAVDKAGNYVVDYINVTIEPLKTPIIESYTKSVGKEGSFSLTGKSDYADSDITIWYQLGTDDPKNTTVKSDKDGKFSLTLDKLPGGNYKAWAEVVDSRGARSTPSEKVSFEVYKGAVPLLTAKNLIYALPVAILIILIAAIIFIFKYIHNRVHQLKHHMHENVFKAEEHLNSFFNQIRSYIQDEIKLLEDAKEERKLTEEEKKLLFDLKKESEKLENYMDVEKYIAKD